MGYGVLHSVKHANFVNLFSATRKHEPHLLNYLSYSIMNNILYVSDHKRREILHESAPHLMDKVYSYRGGYIAEVSLFLLFKALRCFNLCIGVQFLFYVFILHVSLCGHHMFMHDYKKLT